MARIFLFNPPDPEGKGFTREGRCTQESGVWATQWPPVSLATASAFLEADGHSLRVIDFPALGWDLARLKEVLSDENPYLALWNTGTPTLDSDLAVAGIVKQISPRTKTAVMGTHVSVYPEQALKSGSLDVVIRGEPEKPIRELSRRDPGEWGSIAGISFRHPLSGRIIHNPDGGFLSPEEIPAPAWHHLDIRPYRLPLKGKTFLIVAPVRGCPYPCSFCTARIYYGKQLRKRPVRNVVEEIRQDMASFLVRDFFFWADTFTADSHYVQGLCEEILAQGLSISWTCNSRVDTVDRDLLLLMKRAGLWMISFGLESGSQEILDRCGKKTKVEQSRQAISLAKGLGIRTSGHFILGLPGETEETMEETLRLALELPLDIAQFYAAAPFPGTTLYEEAVQEGWIRRDNGFSQSHAFMELPGLSAGRVDAFRKRAFRRFYLRPIALRRLLRLADLGMIREIASAMGRFLPWAKGRKREGQRGQGTKNSRQ